MVSVITEATQLIRIDPARDTIKPVKQLSGSLTSVIEADDDGVFISSRSRSRDGDRPEDFPVLPFCEGARAQPAESVGRKSGRCSLS